MDDQKAAAARVAAVIALPDPEFREDIGCFEEGGALPTHFDPWELFPAVYGSYSSEFDDCALTVLRNLHDGGHSDEGLAEEMFREMLCVLELCDYGSSPRVCFPTSYFRPLLPALIGKWAAYIGVKWALSRAPARR